MRLMMDAEPQFAGRCLCNMSKVQTLFALPCAPHVGLDCACRAGNHSDRGHSLDALARRSGSCRAAPWVYTLRWMNLRTHNHAGLRAGPGRLGSPDAAPVGQRRPAAARGPRAAVVGERMTRLGAVIAEAIVLEYGRDEFLRRLAHPFWFQSFCAVMGMDWHSSGITTSVIGALKRGLKPLARELGVHVCGGRGSRFRRETPHELVAIGERVGFDGAALATASRLVAEVDSAAVQDGFDLYLHGFIVTDDGHLVVVQQGMNGDKRQARRDHRLSEGLKSFVEMLHAAIDGTDQGVIANLTDARAEASRRRQIDIPLATSGPTGSRASSASSRAPPKRPPRRSSRFCPIS